MKRLIKYSGKYLTIVLNLFISIGGSNEQLVFFRQPSIYLRYTFYKLLILIFIIADINAINVTTYHFNNERIFTMIYHYIVKLI